MPVLIGNTDFKQSLPIAGGVFLLLVASLAAVAYGGFRPILGFVFFCLSVLIVFALKRNVGLLGLMILLLPFDALVVPGLPLQASAALVIAVVGAIVVSEPDRRIRWHGVGLTLALYLIAAAICLCISYSDPTLKPPYSLPAEFGIRASRYRGWYTLIAIALPVSVFRLTCVSVNSLPKLRRVISLLLSITAIASFWAVYEFIAKLKQLPIVFFNFDTADYVSQAAYNFVGHTVPRVYGTATEPAYFGTFLLCGITLIVGLLSTRSYKPSLRILLITTLLSAFMAEGLTFSLTGWIATIVAVAVVLLTSPNSTKTVRGLGLISTAAATVVIVGYSFPDWTDSILSLQTARIEDYINGSTHVLGIEDPRLKLEQQGREIFLEHPIFGVGMGNEPFWMPLVDGKLSTSGNVWSTSLSETGIFGTTMLAILVLGIVSRLYRFTKSTAPASLRTIGSVGLASFIGLLVASAAWGSRFSLWHWFTAALGFSAANLARTSAPVRHRITGQIFGIHASAYKGSLSSGGNEIQKDAPNSLELIRA